MNGDRFIRLPEVVQRTGLSEATIWRSERARRFPARVRLGPNAVAWRESELVAWMADPTAFKGEAAATVGTCNLELKALRGKIKSMLDIAEHSVIEQSELDDLISDISRLLDAA